MSNGMHTTHEDAQNTTAVTLAAPTSLPTLDRLQQKVDESTAMRALLISYVKENMDPEKHFYTIDGFDSDGKPSLSQDGARNLCSLFEVAVADPELVEHYHADGHYSVRVLIRLLSSTTGMQVATGSGCCSTRESKYAYRWMFANQIPSNVNKADLPTKETKEKKIKMYKVPNPDIADQFNTVLKMAIKRAEVHATLHLPYVSDGFSDTEPDEDDEKALMLKQIGIWARTQKKPIRDRAAQLLWGTALPQIKDLDLEAINAGFSQLQIYRNQGLDWESETLEEDMRTATASAGKQAIADLFGDEPVETQPLRKPTRKELLAQIAQTEVPGEAIATWLPTQFEGKTNVSQCSAEQLERILRHLTEYGRDGMTMDIVLADAEELD